jgi:hypothetical protein
MRRDPWHGKGDSLARRVQQGLVASAGSLESDRCPIPLEYAAKARCAVEGVCPLDRTDINKAEVYDSEQTIIWE